MKILIAEDSKVYRIILEREVSALGFDIITASDGNEAWKIMQKKDAPRLAILDWIMPGIDGPILCQKLKAQDQTEPLYLILLTAMEDQRDIVEGLDAGADDYILKPHNHEELEARINVGVRILKLQNELLEKEKLQGVLEMAGAVCHELNQPLQVVSGFSELLLMDTEKTDPNFENLTIIREQIKEIGDLTKKIMNVTKYESKDYLSGKSQIIDINMASIKD